jgi:hypothetical protein
MGYARKLVLPGGGVHRWFGRDPNAVPAGLCLATRLRAVLRTYPREKHGRGRRWALEANLAALAGYKPGGAGGH